LTLAAPGHRPAAIVQEGNTLKKTRKTSAIGGAKKQTNKPFEKRFPPDTSPAAKALANNVRRLRQQRELSQAELGKAAKADQATIALIELARANPTLRLLQTVAAALKTTPAALLSGRVRRAAKED
jgi:DNA-binding XRE family transcriptional regulator